MKVTFTAPGKLGDALLQWPVAMHYCRETGSRCDVWLDKNTLGPLVPLLQSQPYVDEVKLIDGVDSWNCGGQPWFMNLETKDFKDRIVYHLGMRKFPTRQISLECRDTSNVPLKTSQEDFCETPVFELPQGEKKNRLVIHGQGVYTHTRCTPTVWKFIASIRSELESLFDEICFVGSADDLAVSHATYPEWKTFDDGGDFLKLAEFVNNSRAMIGCGSSPIALAGALKVPSIRVHDPVGGQGNEAPRVIFSNLGKNQLNATEIDLRDEWPRWRAAFLAG